jgi:FlaA1/EpsC-like NDP-sugar epimerase
MLQLKVNTPRWVIVVIDLFLSLFGLFVAYLIRFDLKADQETILKEWEVLSTSIWVYLFVKVAVYYAFKIHKGLIRHTSLEDIRRIFMAVFTCSVLFTVIGVFRAYGFGGRFLFPTSVLIIEFLVSFVFMIGSRFFIKLLYLESIKSPEVEERILIYGAGISGLITKRTIEKDRRMNYQLVGFLDDNKKLAGSRLEGLPIFHSGKLEAVCKEEGVTTLIIAIQQPDEDNRQKVVDICLKNKVKVQKVPNPRSWINGEFSAKQISKVNIDELLGRKTITLDAQKIETQLRAKCVLVTGAAGSIGSGIVKQLCSFQQEKIILLDQAESPLYDLQQELIGSTVHVEIVIADISNTERMRRVFEHFMPEMVFHAAAYKHVPLMEGNPSEAVLTNVKGTKNLVDLSVEFNVEKFVMISTDKAVNPTNVMGASKRIAEIYAQLANEKSQTNFITTRFGNVLGSNGSVIPLFQRQIEQGGPVTVTDERVTRYFMTIPEACQLVLEAGAMGDGGEIFVFDMGESVKILDLAKKMILLSGLELGKDIEIKVTGLRPGEKLFEELLAQAESTIPTHHPKILKASVRREDNDQEKRINELIELFDCQHNDLIVAKMKEIVPEFKSNNSIFEKLDTP